MYGQIHLCLRSLVLTKYGRKTWSKIIEKSGCDNIDDFLTFYCYNDERTTALLLATQSVLKKPLEEVLELFGEHFFIYCYQHGYDKMLKTLGDDFQTFIQNLDSLHSLLAFSYKNMNAPSFRCEEGENGSLILHYYSTRPGLHHIVRGLCRSVGREMFHQNVSVEIKDQDQFRVDDADTCMHHVAFHVVFLDSSSEQELNIGLEKKRSTRTQTSELKYCVSEKQLITGEHLCRIFPFHILFDENFIIQQCGINLLRWTDMSSADNVNLKDVFELVKPVMEFSIDNIKRFSNSNYILENCDKEGEVLLKLRGQMVILSDVQHILFIGSPRLTSIDDMEARNMYLCDIPLYDVTREFVLLNQQRLAEVEVSKKLDETTVELQRTAIALEEEKYKYELLLYQMLPQKVATQLKDGKTVTAERFEDVTILFSDIVTFTTIASAVTPIKIVRMLDDLYTIFDKLTKKNKNLYKVETIGDAYMVVSGCPDVSSQHTEQVADFALEMIVGARGVMSPATGQPLQIRVGFHSGPVVAAVVGKRMPRYCLFGDTVNTSNRMESHGLPGKIHLSSSAKKHLSSNSKYVLERRGNIEIKGKGLMCTYWLRGWEDGTLWNIEYDGTEVIPVSTYQHYKAHGLPDISESSHSKSCAIL